MSQARDGRSEWFELSEEGWRRSNRARPLGQLVREALQNAFDQRARRVSVRLGEAEVRIEDDAPSGLARDEFAFTVFLGEKDTPPTWRGRKGRGLKEMIAASDRAEVETVGRTLVFDHAGRHVKPNTREVGTCLRLFRRTSVREREAAAQLLRLTLPPAGVELLVDGRTVRSPRLRDSLEDCPLETVELHRGVERYAERPTRVDLYHPRPGETPHLFELGLPVEPHHLPWHVDVQQRIPLAAERDAARDLYKRTLSAILLESLAPELNRQELSGAWVTEVLAHFTLGQEALEACDPKARVDAEYDRERHLLRVNMRGKLKLEEPLEPRTLGVILHELAHDGGDEHDFAFIDRLEGHAGRALRCLVDRPDLLAPYARRRASAAR
ncbi:MAG: ATP-binding protein [Cystobacter sp.]